MKSHFHQTLFKALSSAADPTRVDGMEAYQRNQFRFLGVKAELRREAFRAAVRSQGMPADAEFEMVVKELYRSPYREMHYSACELVHLKKWYQRVDSIHLIEWLITENSWWDTVDFIAPNLAGGYFKVHPDQIEEITDTWNCSGNIWLIRSSILFQLKYGKQIDLDVVTRMVLPHIQSKEFFIQKAIGWMLRQISKSNPDFVTLYIDNHTLKPVSLREAKKYLR